MKTETSRAAEYAEQFETRKRDNGQEFVCIRNGSDHKDELTDLVRGLHGSRSLPMDWLQAECRDAFQRIADYDGDAETAADEVEGDVYTHDLLRWLVDFPEAVDAVEEFVNEYGQPGKFDLAQAIMDAQAERRRSITLDVGRFLEESHPVPGSNS